MNSQRVFLVLSITLCIAVPVVAQMSQEEAMKLAQQYQGQGAGMQEAPPPAIELTEKDVTGFIGSVEDLQELGVASQIEADKDGKLEMSEALAANHEAMSILEGHGFTPERFQQVAYSVGYALAALQMKGKEGEIDEAWAAQEKAFEKMKGQLSDEQMQLIRSQVGTAKAAMHQIEDQPAGNLELVRKHMDEIQRVIETASRRR
jgi:hypothetical protein